MNLYRRSRAPKRTLGFVVPLLALAMLLVPGLVRAQTAEDTSPNTPEQLTVGIKLAPPFVIEDGPGYRGIAIELWQQIAEQKGWEYQYKEYELEPLLDAVATGEVDVAIGAITTTAERERRMDFSQPLLSSGLGVAVRDDWSSGWLAVVRTLCSAAFLKIIATLAVVLVVVGMLIWLAERRRNEEQFGGTRAQGIFSGVWWAMVTMTTVGYGDIAPRTVAGRVLGLIWMLIALLLVAFFTASITSALTVGKLGNRVRKVDDLYGMQIASVPRTTSGGWLEEQRLEYVESNSLKSALDALESGAVDAVVYDAPLLNWQISQDYRGELKTLPLVLERQDYAFAVPPESDLREPLNVALLSYLDNPEWNDRVEAYLVAER